jgi:hypothetical protein
MDWFNLIIVLLGILSSGVFLYYWGKSGYDWGTFDKDEKNKYE